MRDAQLKPLHGGSDHQRPRSLPRHHTWDAESAHSFTKCPQGGTEKSSGFRGRTQDPPGTQAWLPGVVPGQPSTSIEEGIRVTT